MNQPPGRIRRDSRIHRVCVPGRGFHFHVYIEETFDTHSHLAGAVLLLLAALPHITVALNQVRMCVRECPEIGGTDLLLTLKHKFDMAGQCTADFFPCVHGTDPGHQSVFIVRHAAGIDYAVPDFSGKGV